MPSESTPRKANAPVRIGKYQVTSHIATGGMSSVYRARDTETGGEVALKVLSAELAGKPLMVERFRREARSAGKLQHENIVRVFEFGEEKGTYYIAMEYVDGTDLLEHIEEHGPLDPEESRQIMLQACRALKHAYENGIVHRDVKPSNFLMTKKNGRMLVKLTDLGLARQATADDFRVTRSGTTVGTVDYMAPEQARDSSLADIRSDLYGLGCTWFHMLAKEPPFPDGGLAERIVKHLQKPPPDVRTFNPRASKALTKILKRLLEKKQADRYQTPSELLDDLLSLDPIARPNIRKAKYDPDESDVIPVRGPRKSIQTQKPSKSDRNAVKPDATPLRRGLWAGVGVVAGLLLVAAMAVGIAHAVKVPPADTDPAGGAVVGVPPPSGPPPGPPPTLVTVPILKDKPGEGPPPKPHLPALYEPAAKIDFVQLRTRMDAPWADVSGPPANAPVLRVSRQRAADSPTTFGSVADACAAAVPGQATVIEIDDNGPLYQSTATVAERKVFLRAGKGYRPLIVWDINRTVQEHKAPKGKSSEPHALFRIEGGQLTLDGVDVVLKWSESGTDPVALFHVTDGDLDVQNCTFSVAGKHADGVAWVRFQSLTNQVARCRLRRCYARGACLVALQLDASRAELLVDSCLIVGGEPPLVQVRAGASDPATLRVVRSTLVTANTGLKVQPTPADEHEPAFNWLGWDAVFSRSNEQIGGELLTLPDKALTLRMNWEAVGCLYAGWEKLRGGSNPIGAAQRGDFINWQLAWKRREGDRVLPERFPAAVYSDPAQLSARSYTTAKTPLEFASSQAADEPLGCPLAELPPSRDNWQALTFDRFPVPDGEVLDSVQKPEIPRPDATAFHGARLELTPQFDLGAYLQEVQKQQVLGPRVVLHLAGTGDQKTSPIKVKGSSLVLYFEPAAADDAKPLALTARAGAAPALVEVEDGNLDIINGELSLPEGGKGPEYVLKVSGGDLRLFRCRLQAPHQRATDAYGGLISFLGSGTTAADKTRACLVNESVLSSGHTGIDLRGLGGRVFLRQSVLVAGGDALRVEPGPGFAGRANIQCLLEQSTIAARRAAVHLLDAPFAGALTEPVVVQTQNCVFLNPFAESASRPGVVLCDGDALARGLLVWQGEGDFLDRRLPFGVMTPATTAVDSKPWQAAWPQFWGTVAVRKPAPEMLTSRAFDGNTWALDRLTVFFAIPSSKRKPGADLGLFGTDKKKPLRPL